MSLTSITSLFRSRRRREPVVLRVADARIPTRYGVFTAFVYNQALGLKPFQPFPDKPGTMSYYTPPPEFFEDVDVMSEWGREAVAVGMRAQPGARKKASKVRSAVGRRP